MDILQDEEKIVDKFFLIGKKNIFRTKKKVIKQKQADVQNKNKKKKKTDNLSMFTVMNRYSVLEDNPEFDVDKIIQRNMTLKTSKKKLKKCRYCNFKKRSCLSLFVIVFNAIRKVIFRDLSIVNQKEGSTKYIQAI